MKPFKTFLVRQKLSWGQLLLVALCLALTIRLFAAVPLSGGYKVFNELAEAFLNGKVNLPGPHFDGAVYQGNWYWPLGPFPAVLLLPFVWAVGTGFEYAWLQLLFVFLTLAVFYGLLARLGYSFFERIMLTAGFLGSQYAGLLLMPGLSPSPWYFAHVITILGAFLVLREYLGKQRWWLIGILFACLFLTRQTAALPIVTFLGLILTDRSVAKGIRWRQVLNLVTPLALALCIAGTYNYARFNSFTESGYRYQQLSNRPGRAFEYGLFSPVHIPGNLYYLIFSGPEQVLRDGYSMVLKYPYLSTNPFGMSLLVTTPWLLFLLYLRMRSREAGWFWAGVVVTLLPIISFFGIGIVQYGYRYAFDFLPFLIFLLCKEWKEQVGRLSPAFIALLIGGFILNLLLLNHLF